MIQYHCLAKMMVVYCEGISMTNGDFIRSMNDQQLAEWLELKFESICCVCDYETCINKRLEWLQQEHDELKEV